MGKAKESSSQGKGKGNKGKGRARKDRVPTLEPEPEPVEVSHTLTSTPELASELQGESSRDVSPSAGATPPLKKAKKVKKTVNLTDAEEDQMVEWLKEHTLLYNKKSSHFKNTAKKTALWDELGARMGHDADLLNVWYRSMRTRFGRLAKTKSGDGAVDLTDRDAWIFRNFDFLRPYIYEIRRQATVSLKSKLLVSKSKSKSNTTPVVEDEDEDLDVELDLDQPATPSHASSVGDPGSPARLDIRPRRTSTKKTKAEEAKVLLSMETQRSKSLEIQEGMLRFLKPVRDEREVFTEWTKSVAMGIHPSLWRRYEEQTTILLRSFLREGDVLKGKAASQPQPTRRPHHQYPIPSASGSTSQQDQRWQNDPADWPQPSAVQQTASVWESGQSKVWYRENVEQPQPVQQQHQRDGRMHTPQHAVATPNPPMSTFDTNFSYLENLDPGGS
jgi:hypothetical protein